MSRTAKLLPFTNVAPNSVATLSLPPGDTYERITLKLGGTTFTKAHITGIRVRMNQKVISECTGPDLDAMNSYTSLASDPTMLTIDFSELFARDQLGQSVGAIGTLSGVASLMLEVDIGPATAPTLQAYAQVSGPKPLAVLNKLLRYPVNIGGAGKWPVALPYGQNGSIIKRVYIKSNNMTALEIKKNGITYHDSDKAINEFWQKENKCVPQPGWYVFDPIADKNLGDMLSTADAQTFEFNVTMSAAEAITVYVEYIDLFENL
ncbi:major capsid protein P2 [Chitinilyticum aquatile]|uniref:major capsid protein P2 n=1 Tax=Chitinilyticum aquatile TaxID=362520 RepID=UPI00041353EF|nr:major capsid protein P2 [Chitinilyticum aquatile]